MRREYPRGEEEFGRVLAFSDGVYAIAITLLVLSIDLPSDPFGNDSGALLDALGNAHQQIVSYAISFAVIGRYWVAHHQFFGRLRALDGGLLVLNLVALGLIAFLPFPTDVLGNYFGNAVAVVLYALTVATISGLEVVMFNRAHNNGLLEPALTDEVFRWERAAALSPVVFFVISLPIAFVSTGLAAACWFGPVPYQSLYLKRRKPADADRLLR